MDELTSKSERLNFARVSIEVDLLQPLHKNIFIGLVDQTIQQRVVYEALSKYCFDCCHVGHGREKCYVNGRVPRPPPKSKKLSDLRDVIIEKRARESTPMGQEEKQKSRDIGSSNGPRLEWKQVGSKKRNESVIDVLDERSPVNLRGSLSLNRFDPLLADMNEEIVLAKTQYVPEQSFGRDWKVEVRGEWVNGVFIEEGMRGIDEQSPFKKLVPNQDSSAEKSQQGMHENAQRSRFHDSSLLDLADKFRAALYEEDKDGREILNGAQQLSVNNDGALRDGAPLVQQHIRMETAILDDSEDIVVESGVSKCITILESMPEDYQVEVRENSLKRGRGRPSKKRDRLLHWELETVRLNSNNPRDERELSCLVIKLKRLKHHLKWWNKEVFGNIHDKVKALDLAATLAEESFDAVPSAKNRTARSLAQLTCRSVYPWRRHSGNKKRLLSGWWMVRKILNFFIIWLIVEDPGI
ncbi:uncharacterized protein [Henckelia pumila]|uniref:uncharacterized protein n=1 Tax=Henckelia pumila TaxID=405737 RepID=UPI003C6E6B84